VSILTTEGELPKVSRISGKNISKFLYLTKLFYGKETKNKKITGHVAGIRRERKSLSLCSEILPVGLILGQRNADIEMEIKENCVGV